MKRLIHKLMMLGVSAIVLAGSTQILWAQSTVDLPRSVVSAKEGEEWTQDDSDKAPALRFTVSIKKSDLDHRPGKTEEFEIELDNARLSQDVSMVPFDEKGIEIKDITVSERNANTIRVRFKIPKDVKEGDVISFSIPLLIKVESDEGVYANIIPSTDKELSGLMEKARCAITYDESKSLNCKVEDIKDIEGSGNIANLIFEEVEAGTFTKEKETVNLYLKNKDLKFGNLKNQGEYNYSDTIEYSLSLGDFIEYGGSLKEDDQSIRMIRYKDNPQRLQVTFEGALHTNGQKGTILLKNIPIQPVGDSAEEGEVILTVESDELINDGQSLVVARYVNKKQEEVQQEETSNEISQNDSQSENATEAEAETVQDKTNTMVTIKMGESSYTVNGVEKKMDGAAFVQGNGYMMVPVRYVAEAFGVNFIKTEGDSIILDFGNKTIVLTKGSKEVLTTTQKEEIASNKSNMAVPLVVKKGRVYAPIGEVAQILDLDKSWDKNTKTAMFQNK